MHLFTYKQYHLLIVIIIFGIRSAFLSVMTRLKVNRRDNESFGRKKCEKQKYIACFSILLTYCHQLLSPYVTHASIAHKQIRDGQPVWDVPTICDNYSDQQLDKLFVAIIFGRITLINVASTILLLHHYMDYKLEWHVEHNVMASWWSKISSMSSKMMQSTMLS